MKISFAAGFAPVVESLEDSNALYGNALGIPFSEPESDHPMTLELDGLKYFGLWTLKDCAMSCFGVEEWPADRIKPQGCIEFDVESPEAVTAAADELTARGYGLLVGVTFTPWLQS